MTVSMQVKRPEQIQDFSSSGLIIRNPANTFEYTVTAGAIAANRVLNVPVITATDTLAVLGLAQTLAAKTLTAPDINGGSADSLTALSIRSTGAAYDLTFASAEVLTAGKTLSFNVGDTARTITLSGNPTLADWFDQAVKAASNPTFGNLTITSFAANWTNAGRTVADLGIVTTVDINGGSFDGFTSLTAANAAGPTMMNEAATTTNPTLVPNRAEIDTGIGWASDTLHVVLGGANAATFAVDSFVFGNGLPNNVLVKADCVTNGNAAFQWLEANAYKYSMGYNATTNILALLSTDTDGGGTDADIWRIPDGQTTIDANTTWDINVFDYVCAECGKHGAEMFECCGDVAWQDDVALGELALRQDPDAIALMNKLGLVNIYEDGWAGVSLNRMPFFLLSGMVQMSKRIKTLEAALAVA